MADKKETPKPSKKLVFKKNYFITGFGLTEGLEVSKEAEEAVKKAGLDLSKLIK